MSMTRCPLCRARLAGAATCPRCGADLALPQAAGSQADCRLKQALACLAAGDHQRGTLYAEQALQMHRTPLTEVVAGWVRSPEFRRSCGAHDKPARQASRAYFGEREW